MTACSKWSSQVIPLLIGRLLSSMDGAYDGKQGRRIVMYRLQADGLWKSGEWDEGTKALLWRTGGEVDLGTYRTWLVEYVRR